MSSAYRRGGLSVDNMVALAKGGAWDTFYSAPVSIDVRDVALSHILAAELPSANVSTHLPMLLPETLPIYIKGSDMKRLWYELMPVVLPSESCLAWLSNGSEGAGSNKDGSSGCGQ